MRQNEVRAFEIRFVKEEGMLNFHFYLKSVLSLAPIVQSLRLIAFSCKKVRGIICNEIIDIWQLVRY